ncbi:MAG TPA: SDR family NAD(P)-dependent oxidoreductase, partial [Blastocatellia bacterium]|nr:SDR family NAD(P)-dependent oxidoreductase [Blastocatellia bacterium]
LREPKIGIISNVTGRWMRGEEARDVEYWVKHMSRTVRFADGISELLKAGKSIFLEVGPGNTLCSLALQQAADRGVDIVALPSMRHAYNRQEDMPFLLDTLGKLWLAGAHIDWNGYYAGERRRRVTLPTYPYERKRHWIEPQPQTSQHQQQERLDSHQRHFSFKKSSDIAQWFYLPCWKRTAARLPIKSAGKAEERSRWLVFVDKAGIGDLLVKRLEEIGYEVISATVGERFTRLGDRAYSFDPRESNLYGLLIRELRAGGHMPQRIVHLWSIVSQQCAEPGIQSFDDAQPSSFFSLLYLSQALAKEGVTELIRLDVITQRVQEVTGEERLNPEAATVIGPCKVIPQEYRNITCRHIDIDAEVAEIDPESRLFEHLIGELTSESPDPSVALRRSYRWVQTFEPARVDRAMDGSPRLREGGVYLITGGLGKIGLILARHLAKTVKARLILTGRTPLPARETWDSRLATHGQSDPLSRKLAKLKQVEDAGGEVLALAADVADEKQMRDVIRQGYERFGALHGVIHAAGVITERSIQEMEPSEYIACIRPKAHGLYVLEKVLEDCELDFCLLFSSSSAILGGLELIAYVAANAFMDAYAHWHNRKARVPWISADWDTWSDDQEGRSDLIPRITLANLIMTRSESLESFERVLGMQGTTQVIVSPGDLHARIAQWNEREPSPATAASAVRKSAHPRPNLRNAYVAATNDIEQRLAEIWQEVLGIEQVGIYDNFFELGGHSLLGTRVISRVRKSFSIDLPIRLLFDAPTIAEFAETVIRRRAEQVDNALLREVLAGLDQMPEEEAQMLLAASEFAKLSDGGSN